MTMTGTGTRTTITRTSALALATMAALLLAGPASAHTGLGQIGGFEAGVLHPITGLDHVVAMVAVGLWGGILGRPALWLLPVTFPLFMALSGVAGVLQLPLPGIEVGIALSGIVLGLCVLLAVRPPLPVALGLVAVFAVFHGYAHGAELPQAANPALYALGFVLTTGFLHLIGIAIGSIWQWRAGQVAVRTLGGAIALAGGAFLTGFA